MLVIPMVERFSLRKKLLKIRLWHKLTPMCGRFLVLVWGGGLIFRVVSNSLDIYTISFTSKYSFDDMNKNVFMPCIITGMNFRKFPKVEDTEKVT